MMRRLVVAGISAVMAAALVASGAQAATPEAKVVGTATLPDIPLASFSNALLPGSVANDRGVDLGGIGSDLFPAERPGEFWTVTDRGPNGQIKIDGANRRTFPVPGFDPAIVKVKVAGSKLQVLNAIPITTRSGAPVTGLPNQASRDEIPYTYDASTRLELNPNGLDTEGIVRAHDGTFWLVDEYSPSLVHVSRAWQGARPVRAEGAVADRRRLPGGRGAAVDLPDPQGNRGFEGLAQLPGGDLVLALQSPLLNPSKAVGEASRTTRLLRFSPHGARSTAQYAYQFDPVGVVDPGEDDTS